MSPLPASALYVEDAAGNARRFRAAREADWRRLEALLDRAERKSPAALSDEDLLELPVVYRAALSSLSVARETSLDAALLDYLEGLGARAYFFIYGVRGSAWSRLGAFFAHDWPAAVRALRTETLIALALTLVGAVVAYVMVLRDPAWFYAVIPRELAQGRDPAASVQTLRSALYSTEGHDFLGAFATFLFTHNAQVSLMSFALGFAFGVPTALLLIYNGCMLGALLAVYAGHGLAGQLGGWLSIHGTTELFAIMIAGAGGMRIGWAVAFPGTSTRMASATRAGRTAATAMLGVVVMLFVAGLLEGVARQTVRSDLARYAIGWGILALWLAYFYLPRRADA